MELTDSQLLYFVHNRLKLEKGKRAEFLAQVDRLIEKFDAACKGDPVINIKRFLKTGSLQKGHGIAPQGRFWGGLRRGRLPQHQRVRRAAGDSPRPHPQTADEDLSHEKNRGFQGPAAHARH
jgi:hypothetical protein